MTIDENCEILLIPPEIDLIYLEDKQFMPLGILALASALRSDKFKVKVYQPVYRLFNQDIYNQVARHILQSKPKYIGFSTWCNTFASSLLLAEQLKLMAPEKIIIFGGPHSSILPVEILSKFSFIDFILSGEADFTLPQLLTKLKNNQSDLTIIHGLTFRNNKGEIIQNEKISAVPDLNKLPIPAYDLTKDIKIQKLDVGRGCPFNCSFCSTNNFFSKKYRTKSAERIIEEMDLANKKSGITSFSFAHDLFTFNKKFVFDFCSKLIGHRKNYKRNFEWTCSARIDCVTTDMLKQMKDAGCHSIFFGIESGSEKIQRSIKKNLKLQNVLKIAHVCRQLNMKMYASFIIGFPDETKADIEKTLELIIKLICAGAQIQISELSILKGTPLFTRYSNKIKFDGTFSNFSHAFIGKKEQQLIIQNPVIFSSFYYLPVKSLSRESIIILTRFINMMGKFRNTLFLIRTNIIKDIEEYNLLHIFLQNKEEIKKQFLSKNSNSQILIHLIYMYLEYRYKKDLSGIIQQVFKWESTQNVLKDNYITWKIIKAKKSEIINNNYIQHKKENSYLTTPIWEIFMSRYDLQHIIPEMNGWIIDLSETKEGNFYYLLSVVSNKNCKLLCISKKDYELLDLLKNESFELFKEKAKTVYSDQEFVEWLFQLENNGILINQGPAK